MRTRFGAPSCAGILLSCSAGIVACTADRSSRALAPAGAEAGSGGAADPGRDAWRATVRQRMAAASYAVLPDGASALKAANSAHDLQVRWGGGDDQPPAGGRDRDGRLAALRRERGARPSRRLPRRRRPGRRGRLPPARGAEP